MPEALSSQSIAFLTCPNCNGTGRLSTKRCPQCRGLGFGALYGTNFLYCRPSLSTALIHAKALKKIGDTVITGVSYTIFIAGLIALGIWLYTYGFILEALTDPTPASLASLNFWSVDHPFLLFFWIGAGAGLFSVYRLNHARDRKHLIGRLPYDQTSQDAISQVSWEEIAKGKTVTINVSEAVDDITQTILEQAFLLAKKFKNSRITSLHLFAVSLFCSPEIATAISRLGVSEEKLTQGIGRQLNNLEKGGGEPVAGVEVAEILIEAYVAAAREGHAAISPLHIILPCFDHNQNLQELLYDLEIDHTKLYNVILWLQFHRTLVDNYRRYKKMARFKPSSNMDRAYTALATPLLDHFSYDWTLAAKWGRVELCVERDEEIKKIFELVEKEQNGLLLVGPFGVGKTTVVGGLAQRMVLEEVPMAWQDKRLIELDASRLLGGLTPDQAEERFLNVISEVSRARNIVLYIKDLEKIMGLGSGQEQSLDMASVLADAVSRGQLYCLASVTNENYRKYVEESLLGSIMAKVEINEPELNTAIRMVESKIPFIESKHQVYFSYNSVVEVVELTARYLHDRYLPEKAINVLESVAVIAARQPNKTVDKEAIAQAITELTHIPVTKLTSDESQTLLHLEEQLHQRVIGQDEAVKLIAAALRRARVEMRDQKRPIANFLFLGPTGVGKTELAKAVAETYFGKEEYMVRLDMSEYQNSDSVNKMIGSPEGVTGYLTEAIRRLPFTLILLDEIEKAHHDILNLFLQVMDDGRLTDGQGRTIDFSNCIIIATSNIGSTMIQEKVREHGDLEILKTELINKELVKVMRPELINRFDGVVLFQPLEPTALIAIANLLLEKVRMMVEDKGYSLYISDTAVKKLAELGFQPEYGARPMRRLIQEKIEDAITTTLLEGKLQRRDTVVVNDDLTISVKKAPTL